MATCINCRQEIDARGMVCPFCHTNPYLFGSQPYSGIDPNMFEGDGSPIALSVIGGVLGAICLPAFPIVGGAIIGSSILYGIWWVIKG